MRCGNWRRGSGSWGRPLTQQERDETLTSAPLEVARPVAFGVGIILIVFLPILALEGAEGKLFKPMALTMIFALAGSLVLALTLTPVLASLFLPRQVKEKEPWVVRVLHRLYEPLLNLALRFRTLTLLFAVVLVVAVAFLAMGMGREFLPKLGEGAIVGTTVRLAGISVEEAVAYNDRIEQLLLAEFPDEITNIWTRLGERGDCHRPDGDRVVGFLPSTQATGPNGRKPIRRPSWWRRMREVFAKLPGMTVAFSQPIEMRLNEMIAGVRSEVAIKVYGDDLETLRRLSDEVQAVLGKSPWAGRSDRGATGGTTDPAGEGRPAGDRPVRCGDAECVERG